MTVDRTPTTPLTHIRLSRPARMILRAALPHGSKGLTLADRQLTSVDQLHDYGLATGGNRRMSMGPRGGFTGGEPYVVVTDRGARWLRNHDRWRKADMT